MIAVLVALPLGVVAAWRYGSTLDRLATAVSLLGFSLPVFVVGYVLAYVFAPRLRWMPVQGFTSISAGIGPFLAKPHPARGGAGAGLRPHGAREGGGRARVLFVHTPKNAAVPIVTVIGFGFAALISGAAVTESVFAIPGIGRLVTDAILRRDYPEPRFARLRQIRAVLLGGAQTPFSGVMPWRWKQRATLIGIAVAPSLSNASFSSCR